VSADPAVQDGKYFPNPYDFDTEHDYYWYLEQDTSKKLPGIGGVFNAVNMDVYHYGGNNPVKLVDPDGEIIVPLIYAYVAHERNEPDQERLADLDNDPATERLDIYTEGSAFGQEGLHHIWVTDGEEARGRHGKSGHDLTDDGHEGGPKGAKLTEALSPDNQKNKIGEVLLPAGTDPKEFMDEVKERATEGLYLPWINDCHNTVQDAARKFGGEVKYNGNYKGRMGKK